MRIVSYANVASTLALVVALSGGAYAATQLPKNSVGAPQLKKNAVTGAKVKDHSLTAKDFQGAGLRGATGPQGPQGEQGATGPTGPSTGAAGGDLTGSFPDPTIGDGKVDSTAIADGTILSADLDSSVGTSILGGTSLPVGKLLTNQVPDEDLLTIASIAANTCATRAIAPTNLSVTEGDIAVVLTPAGYVSPVTFEPTVQSGSGGGLVRICNVGTTSTVPSLAGLVFGYISH